MSGPMTIFHVDMNFVSLREDYLRSLLAEVANKGFDAILWEIEDKVQLDTCSHAIWPEAFTKKQFRSILDYSRELGLEPIPLLQTVGHGEYVMKHKEYAHLREQADRSDCYCTSNPQAREFLRSITAEYVDLFGDIRYFHFGGDEAYVFATCPRCAEAVRKTGHNRLYADHINHVSAPAVQAGIRPGIWCDMIMHHPDQVEAIDKKFVIWDWNYNDTLDKPDTLRLWGKGWMSREQMDENLLRKLPDLLDENGDLRPFYIVNMLKRLGYDAMLCSSVRASRDPVFSVNIKQHCNNVAGAAIKATKENILGHCVTSWAVRIVKPDLHDLSLAIEPIARANPDKTLPEMMKLAGEELFGTDPSDFIEAADMISQTFVFVYSGSGHGSGVQWNHLKDSTLPPKGYVMKSMEEWSNDPSDDQGGYANRKQKVLDSAEPISKGLELMKSFAPRVTTPRGKSVVNDWIISGMLQLGMNRVAQEVFNVFENKPTRDTGEMLNEVKELKQKFIDWAGTWMTPQSAQLNADIIFNHIAEVFGG